MKSKESARTESGKRNSLILCRSQSSLIDCDHSTERPVCEAAPVLIFIFSSPVTVDDDGRRAAAGRQRATKQLCLGRVVVSPLPQSHEARIRSVELANCTLRKTTRYLLSAVRAGKATKPQDGPHPLPAARNPPWESTALPPPIARAQIPKRPPPSTSAPRAATVLDMRGSA